MSRRKKLCQPPVVGGRAQSSGGVTWEIEECLRADMRERNASKFFVISTILAKHYGIKGQPDFRTYMPKSWIKDKK